MFLSLMGKKEPETVLLEIDPVIKNSFHLLKDKKKFTNNFLINRWHFLNSCDKKMTNISPDTFEQVFLILKEAL